MPRNPSRIIYQVPGCRNWAMWRTVTRVHCLDVRNTRSPTGPPPSSRQVDRRQVGFPPILSTNRSL